MAVYLYGLHKNRQAKPPGNRSSVRRIFDRDFAEFLLFILLEQMFARRERNERKRAYNRELLVASIGYCHLWSGVLH